MTAFFSLFSPNSRTKDKLADETGLDPEIIENAIAILIRHDVIKEEDSNYQIIVELFRRWLNRLLA